MLTITLLIFQHLNVVETTRRWWKL